VGASWNRSPGEALRWGDREIPRHTAIDPQSAGASAICLAVADDALPRVAHMLARAPWPSPSPLVFHLAGSVSLDALEPLARRGAITGSLHPLRSFPEAILRGGVLDGHLCAVTSDSEDGRRRLQRLARDVGGRPVDLDDGDRAAWHLAGVAGSNFLVAMMDFAEQQMARAGMDVETARAGLTLLAEGALRAVREVGPAKALTGPVARGDRSTLERHRRCLADHPRSSEVYEALVAYMTARLGESSGD